jgi:hypothetical protein
MADSLAQAGVALSLLQASLGALRPEGAAAAALAAPEALAAQLAGLAATVRAAPGLVGPFGVRGSGGPWRRAGG